ncbi:MAG: hypothetical protein NZL90_03300 [Aquificaceae bacterium]|nr:hypothetical protein [Aquificaceae bacterium]MDW8237678.1 hypothetical protein [Aquificaceae bacterium]
MPAVVYKIIDDKVLFRTSTKKLQHRDLVVHLELTHLIKRFILVGDSVGVAYGGVLLQGRVVGKSEHLIVELLYGREGKFGDRSKPRVMVPEDMGFKVLLKTAGPIRSFEPYDISEEGFAIMCNDPEFASDIINKEVEFRFVGREELSSVSGSASLVSISEEGPGKLKLAFETKMQETLYLKLRFYIVEVIKRILNS